MVIGKIKVTGTRAETIEALDIPQGIVGATVSFDFSEEWSGLTKNVVFIGAKDVEILNIQDSVYLPPEVVSAPNIIVKVGVVGMDSNKKLVIPTLWADLGTVKPGAPVDMGYEPTLPIWAQLLGMIGDLRGLNTADKSNLVAAINEAMSKSGGVGGYYTPVVTQPAANTMQVSFVPSVATMPAVEPVTITLPGSDSGQNGNQGGADYTFLHGLKYYACGDSIVDMQGTLTAPETFGDSGYSTDLQSRSIGDVTVEGYVTAIERRYGLVATNYGKGGHTLVGDYSTLASMNYSDVALVTIAYGVNDARTGVPLGTVNSTDVTTFAGALNQLLRKIYTDNPECRVLVLSPMQRLTVTDFGIATPNANGNYLIDFVNMCKAIAEKRATAFLDQYRCTGINQTNLYYYTVEGVHPVNQGFARIRNAVIGILDDLFALEYEPIGVMTNTGDTEPEEPDTGGDTGGEEPPEEDTGVSTIDLTDKLTMDGYYYTYNSTDGLTKMGANLYKGNAEGILTESGKTYTLVTYLKNDGVWIGCFASYANPAECTNWCDGFNAGKRGSKEEVTINGTVYLKWTYSFAGSNNYLYVGCITELVDKVSLTYI